MSNILWKYVDEKKSKLKPHQRFEDLEKITASHPQQCCSYCTEEVQDVINA
jgi:hypothetical protein